METPIFYEAFSDESSMVSIADVNGGQIYRYQRSFFRKNQYGETDALVFIPYGLLKRLSIWVKSLF